MLFNDPKTFCEDMLAGYADAYSDYIMQVPGGIVSVTETPKDKVAVINGGGSGHYPAFCGIIGPGFMDGTVVGNVFTSPSTEDVLNVARTVENGNGIFIIGGNYAGDKMNFDLARDRLISEGVDARTFYVTDDIASAPLSETEKRRGNVGTFTVFKIAGAAATTRRSLDEIVRLTAKANERTRTMSIGFKGCTLPGAQEPKFHVPAGKMEVGQGIHGEAGVYESDLLSASKIAELLVDKVLSEAPQDNSRRIGVILDGLGSTKYEELFVVWKTVSALFKSRGYSMVDPLVGEFVTSLDMAGIALSVIYLDDELEQLWKAPADTPAFKKGELGTSGLSTRTVTTKEEAIVYAKGTDSSQRLARAIMNGFHKMQVAIVAAEEELAQIDSVAGDGDHGRGMVKGATYALKAAEEAVNNGAGAGDTLIAAGRAWAEKAGGTSGVLWGNALESAGLVIGNESESLDSAIVAKAFRSGAGRIVELGQAHLGDKTMLDALIPFVEEFERCADKGVSIRTSWEGAAVVAEKAAADTAALIPKIGRARPQAERSIGTPDAGAISFAICVSSVL